MEGIKDTSTLTFRKILGNGLTYEVPKFQRDYSWENEHWDDLWQDLEALYDDIETSHYMGYLVLQTSDQKTHRIIDGQQRITTMSLLIIAAIKKLKELVDKGIDADKNQLRKEQIQNSYIGYLDPVTLVPRNKLKLNRNNDKFYKTYIVPLEYIPQRGTNSSEKLMRGCFEWFFNKLSKRFTTGEELSSFIDKIVDKLFFTVITVGDELNAYKVFETLNARGVQLSSSDLLKNYLFSIVDSDGAHDEEFNQLETLWNEILSKLGSEKLPEFLRYYWNSRNKTTRKNDLFKTIKKSINSKEEVFSLLRELTHKADIFIALKNPNDELWNENKNARELIEELKLFGAKQPTSLLIAAYDKLKTPQFNKILKICSIIYFRYNIIGGLNPNDQEIVFNKIANFISTNSDFNKSDFETIYPKDDEFEIDFANKELRNTARNRRIIKYVLTKIENDISGTDYDVNSDRNSIEHIMPENPSEQWDVSDEEILRSKYRLGNLTLLEKSKNNNLKNVLFQEKQEVFRISEFKTTKKLATNYEEWNEDTIIRRQKEMAKRAKSIWKIQFN
ncbi:DUF262 domain-containing protein [Brumimicrobium aurantiacum]|uniref:DUF262 domain-containing protein n=1 Tax=Brumimicrobium aurantiacum TaxID=1737063 RepID=A0A3E1EXA9_9FLAO|nr:DUF262 domain-containing protein [Brumimicrobium aurantiacum]RFC54195.1 DUF262 domain-containing protein [Brumimicrobium aurantiacum]